MSYLFLFSFPGSPSIYYGEEIGLGKKDDTDNRCPMVWDVTRHNKDLKAFFKKMIILRNEYNDFKALTYRWIKCDKNLLVYQKGKIIFIINNSNEEAVVEVEDINKRMIDKPIVDIFNQKIIKTQNILKIKPFEFKILKKNG